MSSQSFSQLVTVNLKHNGIKIKKQCFDVNYVKTIRIRGLNANTCFVSLILIPEYNIYIYIYTHVYTYIIYIHIPKYIEGIEGYVKRE